MSPKRKRDYQIPKDKRHRNVMSLSDKVKILDKLDNGASAPVVASEYGVNESTIRYIRKVGDKIRASVQSSSASSINIASVSRRDPLLEKMEKMLYLWIEEQIQENAPLTGTLIRNRALAIYEALKVKEPGSSVTDEETFRASRGWLNRFKTRLGLHGLRSVGECMTDDVERAKSFPSGLAGHIESKRYTPNQVFNAAVTELFWKKAPDRTYVPKQVDAGPEFVAAQERLTLLLCCNASGDFKCKPMLAHHAQNSHAHTNKNKECLTVSCSRSCVAQLFEDWFKHCFIVEVKQYLQLKSVPFKVLLLIEDSSGYDSTLSDDPNVEVMCLSPDMASILQPLSQGISATFKSYYARRCFSYILNELEKDSNLSMSDCWSRFNISNAIEVIEASWDEVESGAINECWKKLWPSCVNKNAVVESEIQKMVVAAKHIRRERFQDIEEADIEEFMSNGDEKLLDDLCGVVTSETATSSVKEEPSKSPLTTKELQDILNSISDVKNKIINLDPDAERSQLMAKRLDNVILPYRVLYNQSIQNVNETSLAVFIKTEEPSAEED